MSEETPPYDVAQLRRVADQDQRDALMVRLARDLAVYRAMLIRCNIPEPLLTRLLIVFQTSYLAAVWGQPVVVQVVSGKDES